MLKNIHFILLCLRYGLLRIAVMWHSISCIIYRLSLENHWIPSAQVKPRSVKISVNELDLKASTSETYKLIVIQWWVHNTDTDWTSLCGRRELFDGSNNIDLGKSPKYTKILFFKCWWTPKRQRVHQTETMAVPVSIATHLILRRLPWCLSQLHVQTIKRLKI